MRKETKACIEISFVNILWGLSFIASKSALGNGFMPFSLAFARFAIASVLLVPIVRRKEGTLRLKKGTFLRMLWSALLGMTLYFLCEYNGLERTSASTASLIIAAIPAFTLLYGVIFRKNRPSFASYAGVAASLAGVFLIVRFGGNDGQDTLVGDLFILGACFCWVGYIEVTDKLSLNCSSLEITFWQSVLGAATLLPCALTERLDWGKITTLGWIMALYLAVLCSVVAYILYVNAMKALGPFQSALFINLNPVAAVAGGVLLLGENLTLMQVAGGIIVLLSIFLVTSKNDKAP